MNNFNLGNQWIWRDCRGYQQSRKLLVERCWRECCSFAACAQSKRLWGAKGPQPAPPQSARPRILSMVQTEPHTTCSLPCSYLKWLSVYHLKALLNKWYKHDKKLVNACWMMGLLRMRTTNILPIVGVSTVKKVRRNCDENALLGAQARLFASTEDLIDVPDAVRTALVVAFLRTRLFRLLWAPRKYSNCYYENNYTENH